MRIFSDYKDFKEKLLSEQNIELHKHNLIRLIIAIYNDKYVGKPIDIRTTCNEGKLDLVAILNDVVQEVYQGEQAYIVDVTEIKNDKVRVKDEKALKRIWKLFEDHNPPDVSEVKPDENNMPITMIPVDEIDISPYQTRETFDDVPKLAKSIKKHGLLVPIIVKESAANVTKYELGAGERRLRAVKLLGWTEVPGYVFDKNKDFSVVANVENFQRSQPNIIAVAKQIWNDRIKIKKTNCFGDRKGILPADKIQFMASTDGFFSCKEIDDVLEEEYGFSKNTMDNMVALLKESEDIQERVKRGELSIAEGIMTLNIDERDLPAEFVRALRVAENRSKIIENLEKRARNKNDPDFMFLKCYHPLVGQYAFRRLKMSEGYKDKVDPETFSSVKEQAKILISNLVISLGINLNEITVEKKDE
jgi:ParB-like chromosome segregation protein Spo0J